MPSGNSTGYVTREVRRIEGRRGRRYLQGLPSRTHRATSSASASIQFLCSGDRFRLGFRGPLLSPIGDLRCLRVPGAIQIAGQDQGENKPTGVNVAPDPFEPPPRSIPIKKAGTREPSRRSAPTSDRENPPPNQGSQSISRPMDHPNCGPRSAALGPAGGPATPAQAQRRANHQ